MGVIVYVRSGKNLWEFPYEDGVGWTIPDAEPDEELF